MKNQESNLLFICACFNTEHQLIMNTEMKDTVFCSIFLKPDTFFKRVVNGFKYIFGYKSKYGDFDEFIFRPEDADKLQKVVDHLKGDKPKVSSRRKKNEKASTQI